MKPFSGYWVRNDHPGDVTLHVPPVEATATIARQAGAARADGWNIHIIAHAGGASADATLGVLSSARDGRDLNDELAPPMSPGEGMSLYAYSDVPRSQDYRSSAALRTDGGITWPLDVAKNFVRDRAGDSVTLSFTLAASMPAEERAILIDRRLDRVVNLQEEPEYRFILGERAALFANDDARFVVVVGRDAYVAAQRARMSHAPSGTVLHQNTPNPFNPTTVIRYDLAAPADVTLRIYDIRGALVKSLERGHRPAGRYEIGWNGENEQGERVASGVYFCELRAGTFRETRKMILLK